jgi:hypothetical protein
MCRMRATASMGLKKMGTRERVVHAMRCESDNSVLGEEHVISRLESGTVLLQTVDVFGRPTSSECDSST